MVQMYDHRAASVVVNADNLHRPAQQEASNLTQHADPSWFPSPQFFVSSLDLQTFTKDQWVLAFKQITAPTNARTMIASVLPVCGVGHSMCVIVSEPDIASTTLPLLLANLNSFVFDYLGRQKVQGQNYSVFILEQLPVINPTVFEKILGSVRIADFVRGEVLRLSYTAHDLAPFARDMGYDGAPYKWDEDDRRHRLARLDALFFNLYGISRDDAAYILDTFPIVREQDIKAHGRYLTKELILAYMNAVAAGDFTTVVQV